MDDIIHNPAREPSFDEITASINPPARILWEEFHDFIRETFSARPKIAYSTCAGKPGWNVKYQKAGKSICTVYPEKDCWVALVVIKVELAGLLAGAKPALHPSILHMASTVKPFNNTIWLMVPVGDSDVLESVKDLLVLKRNFK